MKAFSSVCKPIQVISNKSDRYSKKMEIEKKETKQKKNPATLNHTELNSDCTVLSVWKTIEQPPAASWNFSSRKEVSLENAKFWTPKHFA